MSKSGRLTFALQGFSEEDGYAYWVKSRGFDASAFDNRDFSDIKFLVQNEGVGLAAWRTGRGFYGIKGIPLAADEWDREIAARLFFAIQGVGFDWASEVQRLFSSGSQLDPRRGQGRPGLSSLMSQINIGKRLPASTSTLSVSLKAFIVVSEQADAERSFWKLASRLEEDSILELYLFEKQPELLSAHSVFRQIDESDLHESLKEVAAEERSIEPSNSGGCGWKSVEKAHFREYFVECNRRLEGRAGKRTLRVRFIRRNQKGEKHALIVGFMAELARRLLNGEGNQSAVTIFRAKHLKTFMRLHLVIWRREMGELDRESALTAAASAIESHGELVLGHEIEGLVNFLEWASGGLGEHDGVIIEHLGVSARLFCQTLLSLSLPGIFSEDFHQR